uniref:Uncharacterized protein n=1 Tax=Romanomermis culicivorax TaxID=13658 RepID=A0A915IQY7_ROMCU
MKSNLTDRIIELLNFPVSPMYKLAIRDHLQYDDLTTLHCHQFRMKLTTYGSNVSPPINHYASEPIRVPITVIIPPPFSISYRWMGIGSEG